MSSKECTERNVCCREDMELAYGVMVALQVLVLSAQVRILVSQPPEGESFNKARLFFCVRTLARMRERVCASERTGACAVLTKNGGIVMAVESRIGQKTADLISPEAGDRAKNGESSWSWNLGADKKRWI